MSKSIKKPIETDLEAENDLSKEYTLRLIDAAHQALITRKKNQGSSIRFIVNDIIKKLSIIDHNDYFKYIKKNKKDKEYNRIVHVSNILLENVNRERLNTEMIHMQNYAIINKHKIPKLPALLNYIIVTYINE